MEERRSNLIRSKVMKLVRLLPRAAAFSIPAKPRRRMPANKASTSTVDPVEARRKHEKGGRGFEASAEPTSPKVTCTGRVKYRKVAAARRTRSRRSANTSGRKDGKCNMGPREEGSELQRLAGGRRSEQYWREMVRGFDDDSVDGTGEGKEIGQGESGGGGDGGEVATVVLEPQKELNLWKRRMVVPPERLVVEY